MKQIRGDIVWGTLTISGWIAITSDPLEFKIASLVLFSAAIFMALKNN